MAFEGLLQGRTAAAPQQAAWPRGLPLLSAQSDPSAAGSDCRGGGAKRFSETPSVDGLPSNGAYEPFADGMAKGGSEDMYSSFA